MLLRVIITYVYVNVANANHLPYFDGPPAFGLRGKHIAT